MRTMVEGLCSGAGSVTTEDRGHHADHARGIVFGSGVGDYRRPWTPCGPWWRDCVRVRGR